MQKRTDAWTLTTQSWWTLSTHAVALSASESLMATWTSFLMEGLGRNQDATMTTSPVSLFGLTYTCPCTCPQNGAEREKWIANNNTLAQAGFPGSIPDQLITGFMLYKVALAQFLSEYFDLFLSLSFHLCSTLLFHSETVPESMREPTCASSISAVPDPFQGSSLASHSVTYQQLKTYGHILICLQNSPISWGSREYYTVTQRVFIVETFTRKKSY
jgi:hypothetical protein